MRDDTKEAMERIHNYALEEIMGERFGRYSKYIIQDRAIPDVRDGLKPVQRRIIYAMLIDRNTHDKPFKKCANAVGNVLGKFHPHGDTSVYDALIRLSQPWKNNTPLIEVDGNNGSIDGDPPAAMRYTECRLAKISEELVKDIEKDTVNMALNYSDTLKEPTVLPARFPVLLVNGTTGISAGYATNIPPHNLGEVIDATIKRIDSPNCRLESILEIIKGPDFPTGGIVEGVDQIRTALETGRGKVVVRAKYRYEKVKGKEQIIIDEIPFEVNKQMLVKRIDDIRIENRVAGMAEVRDESDKDAMVRIVIDLKAGANKDLIMNYLFKNSDLQTNYSYNMVTIANRRPKQLGALGIIDAYIAFAKEVVTKRSQFDLAVAKKEAHITEGLVKAISILDEVIKVIRASKNKADAKENLVKKFEFTMEQAEEIVTLQLYKLTNTDIVELNERLKMLEKIIAELTAILSDENKLNGVIKEDLRRIKKAYAIPRKTEIKEEVMEVSYKEEDLIVKENVMMVLTKDGYLKKVPMKSYTAAGDEETALKPGDYCINKYICNTLQKICIFTKMGNYIYVPINDIPFCKWKDLGKHVSNVVTIDPNDSVIGSFIVDEKTENENVVLFTKNGMVKRTNLSDYIVSRYNKLYVGIKLKDDDEVRSVVLEKENTMILTKTGYYISYKTSEIPTTSAKASGVKGINMKDDEVVAGLNYDENDEFLNVFTSQKTSKRIRLSDLTQLTRAKRGSMVIKKVKTTSYDIVTALITHTHDEIGLSMLEDVGILKNTDIPIMDLASTGSSIAKKAFMCAFIVAQPIEIAEKPEVKKEPKKTKEEIKQEEIEFIDDFKI